jgi:enoyl-CoA hydratase/carnithine racemase
MDSVTIEEDGPLLLIGVNRPEAHNLWNLEVIQASWEAVTPPRASRHSSNTARRTSRADEMAKAPSSLVDGR